MSTFIIGNVIQVNGTNCIECALCVPECPVEAITDREKYLDVDGFVRLIDVDIYISPDICIGCGDCIPICSTDVFSFISDEDEDEDEDKDEDDENTNPNTPQDPCTAAAQPAAHATELSKTNAFQSTSEQLSTYNDGNEHGYVYGSENGNVVPQMYNMKGQMA